MTSIAPGFIGSMQTLGQMRALVNRSLSDPFIIETARSIIRDLPPRDYNAHARAIREYLAEHLQFAQDPRGQETLATPRYLLTKITNSYVVQGDCDDAAVLGAALAKAVGLRARFIILAFYDQRAPFTHVYTVVKGRTGWLDLDTTRAPNSTAPVSKTYDVEV